MIQLSWRSIARFLLIASLVSIATLPYWTIPNAYAAQENAVHVNAHTTHAATQAHAASNGHVTIIVLDMSGSMVTSDPNGLRCSAANAYIDLSGNLGSSTNADDYIGLIGLDNNSGQTTGSQHFETAFNWQSPISVSTIQARKSLKDIITQMSNNCKPDADTPTYESLNSAYSMLQAATSAHPGISGSVILLTDGVPCPDVDKQINAIQSDLLPKFRAAGWPIDTIGLGEDAPITSTVGCSVPGTLPGTFHDFLHNISDATSGSFYDDGKGPVAGVSPLNIMPFFADIFAKYSGKTPFEDTHATVLNGNSQTRNFTVPDNTPELDVIATRDSANVQIQLQTPNQQAVSYISSDAFHVIYRISAPVAGEWIFSASGTGSFLLDYLQQTNLALQFDSIQAQGGSAAPNPLPLGQPITVNAHLTTNGQLVNNSSLYTVTAYVTYNSTSGDCSNQQAAEQTITLQDNAGTYSGTFTIDTDRAGSYNVLLCTTLGGSLQNVIASQAQAVRLELFPQPFFLSAGQPINTTVSTTVVNWPLFLQGLYSLPLVQAVSSWPLQGHSAQPIARLPLEIQQHNGQLYTNDADLSHSDVTDSNGKPLTDCNGKPLQLTFIKDGPGKFILQFQPCVKGPLPQSVTYQIHFKISGDYADSHGEFGDTVRSATVTLTGPTGDELPTALWRTLLYLVILALIGILLNFWFTPTPYGGWTSNPGTEKQSTHSFRRASRLNNPGRWLLHRNWLDSRQARMPTGLLFRFNRGNHIEARPDGKMSRYWQSSGGPLRPQFQRVNQLIYTPPGQQAGDTTRERYIINATLDKKDRQKKRKPTGRRGGTSRNSSTQRPLKRRP